MKKLIFILCFVLLPGVVLAAYNDVTLDDGVTLILPGNGNSYTLKSSTRVESFSVNTNNFSFVMLENSLFFLQSSDRSSFAVSAGCEVIEKKCTSSLSTVAVQCSSSNTITVTPSGTCGGGGGGGGFNAVPTSGGGSNAIVETITSEEVGTEDIVETKKSCLLKEGDVFKRTGSAAVYYITKDCKKRPFNNSKVFFTYFDSWSDVNEVHESLLEEVENDDLGFMPWGSKYDPKYGALVKIVDDPKTYLLLGAEKYWITDESVFTGLGYKWNWIEDIDEALLNKYTLGSEIDYTNRHPNFTLVKYADSPRVYRLENGKKRYIKNEAVFERLKYRWDRIVEIDDKEVYEDGEDLQ